MRLVFVHGMAQEGQDPVRLKEAWRSALWEGLKAVGIDPPAVEVRMPFYGDKLQELTLGIAKRQNVAIGKGGPVDDSDSAEVAMIREVARRAGITDADIRQELGAEVVAKGPANWEWVQEIARIIERRMPVLGGYCLKLVKQVNAYLAYPHIQQAVDAIVEPEFTAEPTVVVSHSLGTIVSYKLLRSSKIGLKVPLFVTLGSPLGIDVVKQHISPPTRRVPDGVAHWLNGTDERDYVALHSRLDRDSFSGKIENVSDIHNRRDDAHAILDYLSDPAIAGPIGRALAGR